MRLELEKKQKKTDKQNTLHTYDGRLRLPDSEENGDAVDSSNAIDPSNKVNPMVVYNPTNTIIYPPPPAATVMHSTNIGHIATGAPHNQFDDTSRNIGTPIARPSIDLHYAYRNDYSIEVAPSPTVDASQPNYPLLYANSAYYRHPCAASFDDYLSMNTAAAEQTSTSMPYPHYDGLANNNCDVAAASQSAAAPSNDLSLATLTPNSVPKSTLGDSFGNINGLYSYGNHSIKEPYNAVGVSSISQHESVEHSKNGSQQYGAQHAFSTTSVNKLMVTSSEHVGTNETNLPT